MPSDRNGNSSPDTSASNSATDPPARSGARGRAGGREIVRAVVQISGPVTAWTGTRRGRGTAGIGNGRPAVGGRPRLPTAQGGRGDDRGVSRPAFPGPGSWPVWPLRPSSAMPPGISAASRSRWRCCRPTRDNTSAADSKVWCIRAACWRSALVGRFGVRAGGRLPGPCRDAGGMGAGQVTGRGRVARHGERSWSGR
jgi:hypothetical protein